MYLTMQETIKEDFVRYVFHIEAVREDERQAPTQVRQERRQIPMTQMQAPPESTEVGMEGHPPANSDDVVVQQAKSDKIPRNAPCPCGSGKKYKQCHGRPGAAAL